MHVIGHPTFYAHAEQRAFSVPGGTNAANMPLPTGTITGDGGPSFESSYVMGPQHSAYNDQHTTNGRVTWHMPQKLTDYVPGDTCADALTFALIQGCDDTSQPITARQRSHAMFSITTLNRMLKHDPAYRRMYGAHTDAKKVSHAFQFVGVTITHTATTESTVQRTLVPFGRARMPNIWLAQAPGEGVEPTVQEGHSLYLLWRRHLYEGNVATTPGLWSQTEASATASAHAYQPATRPLQLQPQVPHIKPIGKWDNALMTVGAPAMTAKGESFDGMTASQSAIDGPDTAMPPGREYYWALEPWTSTMRCPPNPAAYTGDPLGDPFNAFMGGFIQIGQVVHLARGPNNRTPDQVRWAREALFTDVRNDAWFTPFRRLDELEVFIGIGATPK